MSIAAFPQNKIWVPDADGKVSLPEVLQWPRVRKHVPVHELYITVAKAAAKHPGRMGTIRRVFDSYGNASSTLSCLSCAFLRVKPRREWGLPPYPWVYKRGKKKGQRTLYTSLPYKRGEGKIIQVEEGLYIVKFMVTVL